MLEQLQRENGYQITENIFPGIPNNFEGMRLRITALNWEPFTEVKPLTSEPCSKAVVKESVSGKILVIISRILNFSYTVHEPCEKIWGNRSVDGKWNGILGDLQSERADFTLLLAPFQNRLEVADFTRPYENEPLTFMAAKPKLRQKSFALVKAFTELDFNYVE
ncbi:Glutamate receptor ionotropic, delta-2 [Armadillidium vulgare]|nr:Glutamate receptor ionotropic, delta-2 [Armadillidium vulgare]